MGGGSRGHPLGGRCQALRALSWLGSREGGEGLSGLPEWGSGGSTCWVGDALGALSRWGAGRAGGARAAVPAARERAGLQPSHAGRERRVAAAAQPALLCGFQGAPPSFQSQHHLSEVCISTALLT